MNGDPLRSPRLRVWPWLRKQPRRVPRVTFINAQPKPFSVRDAIYVTNTVKHFKWEPRGKRRIHQKPSSREIAACRPWLETELRLIKPQVLVCLGATAAQALFGSAFRVTRERGKILESPLAQQVVTTVHPSSLLRQPNEESRAREYALFLADLRVAARAAGAK